MNEIQAPERVIRRLLTNIDITVDECWISRYCSVQGYPQIGWGQGGKTFVLMGHRLAWVVANHQAIPDDLTIDHTCRQTMCVNAAHLRLRTNLDNARDNGQSRRATCPHGHPYTDDNIYLWHDEKGRPHRHCRTCRRKSRTP